MLNIKEKIVQKNDDLTSFKDYKNVSEYAKEAVNGQLEMK